jgi:putative peptide zinc metalloprotease protein
MSLLAGDRRYLAAGGGIDVPGKGVALLTFPGGAAVVICGGSRLEVDDVGVENGRTSTPSARLTLENGRLLADTSSPSGAFAPLALTVLRGQGDVVSGGRAWYSVDPGSVAVSSGAVTVGGAGSTADGKELNCGDGVTVKPPTEVEPSEEPTEVFPTESTPSASVDPSVSPTTVESSAPATETTTEATTGAPTTTAPSIRPSRSRSPSPSTSPSSSRSSSPSASASASTSPTTPDTPSTSPSVPEEPTEPSTE